MNVVLPESQKVNILALSAKCQCKICGSVWGIYIKNDGTFPINFDVCRNCERLNISNQERVNSYGYSINK